MSLVKPILDGMLEAQEIALQRKEFSDTCRRLFHLEECIVCGRIHKPIPNLYLGRGRHTCSDACWDEWLMFGRWER